MQIMWIDHLVLPVTSLNETVCFTRLFYDSRNVSLEVAGDPFSSVSRKSIFMNMESCKER